MFPLVLPSPLIALFTHDNINTAKKKNKEILLLTACQRCELASNTTLTMYSVHENLKSCGDSIQCVPRPILDS